MDENKAQGLASEWYDCLLRSVRDVDDRQAGFAHQELRAALRWLIPDETVAAGVLGSRGAVPVVGVLTEHALFIVRAEPSDEQARHASIVSAATDRAAIEIRVRSRIGEPGAGVRGDLEWTLTLNDEEPIKAVTHLDSFNAPDAAHLLMTALTEKLDWPLPCLPPRPSAS